MHEDVGGFEVAVYDLLAEELAEARCDLPNHRIGLLLSEAAALLQQSLEVTVLTELHDDVEATLGVEHFVELDDVRVLELAEDLDLGVDGLLQVGVLLEELEVDLLDGHALFARILEALVDLTEGALPQTLGLVVAVPADNFQRGLLLHN